MKPTPARIRANLDGRFANAFEDRRPNLVEAASRARDMDSYIARSAALDRDGYTEEAISRLEDAQVAASRSLEALVGARLAQDFRSRAHVARKHFLVAAIEAWGLAAPPVEPLLQTTSWRNQSTYEFSTPDSSVSEVALATAREATELLRATVRAILLQEGLGTVGEDDP